MQNFLLLLLSSIIWFAHTVITYYEITCIVLTQNDVKGADCFQNKRSVSTTPQTLPRNLSLDIETLRIHLGKENGWQIDDINTFQRFKNLIKLQISSIVIFHPKFDNDREKLRLIENLFNVKTLKELIVENCKFNDSYVWKLPKKIEKIEFTYCNYTIFNLNQYRNLISVQFRGNDLRKVPKWSFPPPPIIELILSENESLELTFEDIAPLCLLKAFTFSTININFDSTRRYCECYRLVQWAKEKLIQIPSSIICSNSQKVKCSLRDFGKAQKIRKQCQKAHLDTFSELKNSSILETEPDKYQEVPDTSKRPQHESTTCETKHSYKEKKVDFHDWIIIFAICLIIICLLYLFYGTLMYMMNKGGDWLDVELEDEEIVET